MRETVPLYCVLLLAVVLLSSPAIQEVGAQKCLADGEICDTHERCPVWEEEGECLKNHEYMKEYCPGSCRGEQRRQPPGECKDLHARCKLWASSGECQENEKDMRKYCPVACQFCGDEDEADDCVDNHENCGFWSETGECSANKKWMSENCALSCGTCTKKAPQRKMESLSDRIKSLEDASEKFGYRQTIEGSSSEETAKLIEETIAYIEGDQIRALPVEKVLISCLNRNDLCSFWATLGECDKNKAFMGTNCAPACKSCHLIDFATRCPPLEDPVPALKKGDLNKMFERIVTTAPGNRTLTDEERKELEAEKMPMYTVTVHSRPSDQPATEVSITNDKSLPPWVITFDDFLTAEECEAFIQLGHKYEYKRSEDVGARKFDGSHGSVQSTSRTSENYWCSTRQGCRSEAIPKRIHERMSKVMKIPENNSEDLQMLRYEKGQFYRTHHDFIGHQVDRQCGPRILTFFLYLSDVEEGGGTNFPQLDLTIMPKRGRALLWPSVFDSSPMKKDGRTTHQALDVIKGTKYAANGWIHQYDYVSAQEKGCA